MVVQQFRRHSTIPSSSKHFVIMQAFLRCASFPSSSNDSVVVSIPSSCKHCERRCGNVADPLSPRPKFEYSRDFAQAFHRRATIPSSCNDSIFEQAFRRSESIPSHYRCRECCNLNGSEVRRVPLNGSVGAANCFKGANIFSGWNIFVWSWS